MCRRGCGIARPTGESGRSKVGNFASFFKFFGKNVP